MVLHVNMSSINAKQVVPIYLIFSRGCQAMDSAAAFFAAYWSMVCYVNLLL